MSSHASLAQVVPICMVYLGVILVSVQTPWGCEFVHWYFVGSVYMMYVGVQRGSPFCLYQFLLCSLFLSNRLPLKLGLT